MMGEYDFEECYQYWIAMRHKPLMIGQKISAGLFDDGGEKIGIIFNIEGEQKPESIVVLHVFNKYSKMKEDLRIGGNALFDVVWQDGGISSIPERYIRNYGGVMLIPEIADSNEIEQALKIGFSA